MSMKPLGGSSSSMPSQGVLLHGRNGSQLMFPTVMPCLYLLGHGLVIQLDEERTGLAHGLPAGSAVASQRPSASAGS